MEQLFDSILRGYPIGSFLFWKLQKKDIAKSNEQDSDKLNFQLYQFITNYDERKPHNEKIRIEQIKRDDLSIVLDGQQRLTSLYIGLKGTRTLKKKNAKINNPVNSGGVKLNYSDLLMSILTASFSSDIREKMNELVDALKEKGFPNVGQDQVLKTCLLLIGKDTTFELKNFNKKNIKEIEENWEKITESIDNAAKLLETFGYAGYLGSAYILSSLAYFYFLNSKMNENDKEQALKFVRNAQITSYFTPSTDTKLSAIAHSIKGARTFEEFNHNLAKHETIPLKITNDMIEEMVNYKYSDHQVFPILQILYPNLNYKTTTFHIDHIYPKSKFNEKNKKLNQDFYRWRDYLFNLQLLEGAENIVKKDKDPEVWLKEEYKDNQQAIEEYKKRNYIDPTLKSEWENIKEFREKREEAIIKKLKEVLLPKF
ncbi:DUF262 domain-containing protein [Helicobacter pylori]|uniref:DUF262 domain-containing protein n=1 Tax=Helicobacter pylori TaxID=210 RepID=UPI002738746B|nr:DUF262 domain-containing protein [Helicobacter pylori]